MVKAIHIVGAAVGLAIPVTILMLLQLSCWVK